MSSQHLLLTYSEHTNIFYCERPSTPTIVFLLAYSLVRGGAIYKNMVLEKNFKFPNSVFYIKFCLSVLKFNAPSATENLFNYLAKKRKHFVAGMSVLLPC